MEYWDIYDINRKKTGRVTPRIGFKLNEGEYHVVVNAIIINSKGEILISKRAEYKPHGLKWELSGDSIIVGETSLEGIIREIQEELGIKFNEDEAVLYKTIRKDTPPCDFRDLWLFKKDIDIKKDITFPDGEAIEAKWVNIDELEDMIKNNKMVGIRDFGRADYEKIIRKY